jgi:hypothetical protein
MRRILPLLVLACCAAGCSNAPVAGFLDCCFPSHAKANPDPPPGPPVDVRPGAPVDPIRPAPATPLPDPNPGPIPPPAGVGP